MSLTTVNPALTPNPRPGNRRPPAPRRRDVVENDEYAAFVRRIIRAYARRVATGDVEALTDMVALSALLDEAITDAVTGLRAHGYSWTDIADRLGISRQAAHQRWGGTPVTTSALTDEFLDTPDRPHGHPGRVLRPHRRPVRAAHLPVLLRPPRPGHPPATAGRRTATQRLRPGRANPLAPPQTGPHRPALPPRPRRTQTHRHPGPTRRHR